jgi:hypothetical protein
MSFEDGSIPQAKAIMGRAVKMNAVDFAIPAKAGIQEFQQRSDKLDSRLHGNDDYQVIRYPLNQQGATQ